MMDWIKCTDRMPPDMEPVIVTMLVNGEKQVYGNVRRKGDLWQINGLVVDRWLFIRGEMITHWMLMPKPAED